MSQINKADILVLITLLSILTLIAFRYRLPGACSIDPVLERLRQTMIKVDPRAERLQFFPGDQSYTEDKSKVFICLKDEQGNYYPMNELIQVAIHELAHALCPIIDKEHKTLEFNGLHAELRNRAAALGLFDSNRNVPSSYCPSR